MSLSFGTKIKPVLKDAGMLSSSSRFRVYFARKLLSMHSLLSGVSRRLNATTEEYKDVITEIYGPTVWY
jgi:hypothetical protein